LLQERIINTILDKMKPPYTG